MFVAGLLANRFWRQACDWVFVLAWSIFTLLTPAAATFLDCSADRGTYWNGCSEAGMYPGTYDLFALGAFNGARARSRANDERHTAGTLIGLMGSGLARAAFRMGPCLSTSSDPLGLCG